ncbi:LysR family transcriptional regulator [Streptomyces sp. ISL-94]|uniref:LysR substrate-binding domain-containing protein n=1 Tax=Streptomyces sp. ISL-94 TaxID=2819190 RepID=UPI001BE8C691|nr:LysR family transcriptional regulator [Streptomyces sp. ISL-94]MBT2481969.1 LysR family transcriptional regulator [Streptomyces sp. ISL-94]
MELEIRHLRAVCAIADTGSLHKAARALGVAQPTLTAQLRRIEGALGGQLFNRQPDGCHPTALGHQLLARARPLMTEMTGLSAEMRAAAAYAAQAPQLRIGSTPSRVLSGWVRRLRGRYPGTELTVRTETSSNALLRMVAAGQLDVAFVHEMEGTHLNFPPGLCQRVLLEREPLCLALAEHCPAAGHISVRLEDLADEQWMMDRTADGEWESLYRTLRAAGLTPRLLHGDYSTAALLVAAGEVLTVCQVTSIGWDGVAVRRLEGDPIGMRWLLAARTEAEVDAVYRDLAAAYREVAERAPTYSATTPLPLSPRPHG